MTSLLILGETWFPDAPGGVSRIVHDLHAALPPHVERETLVIGPAAGAPSGVHCVADVHDPLARRVLAYARKASELAERADLVESHFALYAFLPLLRRPLRRMPLVAHFHGPWAAESRASGSSSRLAAAAKHAVEALVYRRAEMLIVHSHAFKRVLVESYGIMPWQVAVVLPGVDLDRFTPADRAAARARLGLPEHAKVVASVRRLVPRMGLDTLLQSVARLEPEACADLVVLIAGDGPERPALERQAVELGIGGRIRFVGRLADDELVDLYRAANLCVVPSRALEGFGLVVLEALACGTPVLATDVGGLAEALGPLASPLLVPGTDAQTLTPRLSRALTDADWLPSAARCRARAEEFSWTRSATRHAAVYEQAHRRPERRRLRVVYLDHCARLSGAEIALVRLLRPLANQLDAHVVLGEDGPLIVKLAAAGISSEVLELPAGVRDTPRARVSLRRPPVFEAAATAAYALRLAGRLRRLRPDLVHANSLKSFVYGGIAARLAGVPLLWHVHDRISEDYLPGAAVRLLGALGRALPSAVIANSHETLRLFASACGPLSVPHAVVYSAVDLERRVPPRAPLPLRFGIVGRLAPWKGQDLFLRAFATAFPDGNETAAIVGAPLFGETAYARSLERLVEELGISARVELTGFSDDVAEELGRLDVLVHASLVPEPLGQVVQEGMAAGIPVVAAGAGGPSELIRDGEDGLLYPPGDLHALRDALARLSQDAGLRARLGAAATARARDFDPQRIAAQVTDVYRAVVPL
jgi:glycosyltransferase involved in cell wall biosynthesis